MPLIKKNKLVFAASIAMLPCMVWGQSAPIHSADVQRLENLNHDAGETLRGAFAAGQEDDLDVLVDALNGQALPPKEALEIMPGEWSCKMIKLGDNLPIVSYSNFKCVVTPDGAFEKTTGSQRTKGKLYLHNDQLIYLGSAFVAGETPLPYEEIPTRVSPQDSSQITPEVGVVEIIGESKGRILFPDPNLESQMNILMLTR